MSDEVIKYIAEFMVMIVVDILFIIIYIGGNTDCFIPMGFVAIFFMNLIICLMVGGLME